MIKDAKQLDVAKKRIKKIKATFSELSIQEYGNHELEMFAAPYNQELEKLYNEIEEYMAIKDGDISKIQPMLVEEIGSLLAKLRIAQNISQSEMVEILGWEQSNISRFENKNYGSQTVKKVAEYADALGVWLYIDVQKKELTKQTAV